MKKISLLLALILLLSLFSCGKTRAPELTDNTWQLGSVVTNEKGYTELLYVSDRYVAFFGEGADTPRLDCVLTAERGALTIEDRTNGKTYTGTYGDEEEFSPDATAYRIVIGSKKSRALTQRLADKDGNPVYTMSFSIGGYELFFMK